MDKAVLFNKPLWLMSKSDDIKEIIEVLGYKISHYTEFDWKDNDDYIDYLCGLSQWQQEGNIHDYFCFYKQNEDDYDTISMSHPNVVNYNIRARKLKGLSFQIYETNKPLDDDTYGIKDTFIVSRELYDNIKNYGAIITDDKSNCLE